MSTAKFKYGINDIVFTRENGFLTKTKILSIHHETSIKEGKEEKFNFYKLQENVNNPTNSQFGFIKTENELFPSLEEAMKFYIDKGGFVVSMKEPNLDILPQLGESLIDATEEVIVEDAGK